MKKPAPSRDGWYEPIMHHALRVRNFPPLIRAYHHGPGLGTPDAGSGSWQAWKSAAVSWYHQ